VLYTTPSVKSFIKKGILEIEKIVVILIKLERLLCLFTYFLPLFRRGQRFHGGHRDLSTASSPGGGT
jgi:hypothetical protein